MEFTSKKERLSYGGFSAGQNIIIILTLQFLLIFYTDFVGLKPNMVVFLFLVARIWDAVNDPIMGMIVDKASLRGGKFKPWVNTAIILLPLLTILVFQNVNGSMEFKLTYAFVTYILWGMVYTMSDIPIFALATAMTPDVDERVKIISIGRLTGGIASLVAVVLFTPLALAFSWTTAAIILSFLAFLLMLPVKYFTVERVVYERKETKIKDIIKSVYRNKYLLIFYLVVIITHVTNSSSSTIVHFVKYNLGNEMYVPILSLAAVASFIILPIFAPRLINRYGKRKLFLGLMTISILSSIAFYFVGYENIYIVFIFVALKYIAFTLPVILMGMFTSDCLEYDYYHHGVRNEGIIFSVQTFAIKITLALQGIIGAYTLGRAGFVANQVQNTKTLEELWRMTTLYPIIGQVIAVVIFYFFYHLSESDVKKMIDVKEVHV